MPSRSNTKEEAVSSSNCHRHVRRLTFSRGLTRIAECGGDFPQQLQRRRCKFPTAPCAPKSKIKHQTSTIVIRKSSSNLRALRGIAVTHHFRRHSSINSSLSANHFNLTLHPCPSASILGSQIKSNLCVRCAGGLPPPCGR